jgi:beta-glucosidase
MKIDFVGKRKIYYLISLTLIIAGIVSMITRGFEMDIELIGGTIIEAELGQVFENSDIVDLVKEVTEQFRKVIVVLNVGGMVDTEWFKENSKISSALLAWQGGTEGGLATADVLCGDVNPSGKLTDTFASSFDDYPSSYNFNESYDYVDYTEDIYVGYRYF